MEKVIEVENLSKFYYRKKKVSAFKKEKILIPALDSVSFDVYKGEIFGLLGPNGAGKTTLIKILTSLLLPTSGNAKVLGCDIWKSSDAIKQSINAMLMGERSIYWKLTGRQNLEYFASLYHISPSKAKIRIQELIDQLDIAEYIDRRVETYSSGQKFKVAFAKALINNPPLVFLDEPTATLDPRAAREVRTVIKELNEKGTTIFLTTHNMSEADELSHRVAILDLGRIIEIDTAEKLKETITKNETIKIELQNSALENKKLLNDIKAIKNVYDIAFDQKTNGNGSINGTVNGNNRAVMRLIVGKDLNLANLISILEKHTIQLYAINNERVTLEDVFLKKTGRLLSEDTKKR